MTGLENLLNTEMSGILSPTVLVLAVFFVIPGFLAMKVYDLTIAAERRNFGNSLIEVVSFSLINLLVWSWLVLLVDIRDFANDHPALAYLLVVVTVIVSPILLAILFRKFLDTKFLRSTVLDPSPTGWDGFFRKQEPCWILFRLKSNGPVVGGYFGLESVASSHPYRQQVYVEKLYRVDQSTHEFLEEVDRTRGGIISAEECSYIEIFREE